MEECLICGEEKTTQKIHRCKLCGMLTEGIEIDEFIFCSVNCAAFFKTLRKKSPELIKREIIF